MNKENVKIEPVDEKNIENSSLSKPKIIIMKAKYMCRAKPLPYKEDDE